IFALIFLVLIGLIGLFKGQNNEAEELDVQELTQALNNGEIKEMTMQPVNKIMRITGELENDNKAFVAQVPDNTEVIATITNQAFVVQVADTTKVLATIRYQASEQRVLKVADEEHSTGFVTFLATMIPFLIIGFFIFCMVSRAQGGGGGGKGLMNFGKRKAKM